MGTYNLDLGINAYERDYSGEPIIRQLNRFVEKSGLNKIEKHISLGRPGTSLVAAFGDGPIRGVFSRSDVFSGDLIVISGTSLFRYSAAGVTTPIVGAIENSPSDVSMDVVSNGSDRRLFFADGLTLQYYDGGTHADGTLATDNTSTLSGAIIQIGAKFYGWGDITTAGQDGTLAHPFLARVGATTLESLQSMAHLLNFDGLTGFDYGNIIGGPSTVVTAVADSNGAGGTPELILTAISQGTDGNSVATVVSAGTGLSFANATLLNGGIHALHQVEVPDGQSPIDVASCAGFLLIAIANSQKFYWIMPGAITIDALNFASAEFAPDNITDIVAVADQVWIGGPESIEIWYPNASAANSSQSFLPIAGRALAHGVLAGTLVKIKDTVVFVGSDNVVYAAGGTHIYTVAGGVNPISTHAISERIRAALAAE